jgi:superfamily I DNA and/or RNA helicase
MPLVDTVEKMQGKEREVILVSYGVADEEYATAEAQFLLSRNRFNVAATRAERKLVVLCSDTVLDAVPTDRRTLLEAMMLKEFRQYCSDGLLQRPWVSSEGDEVTLNIQWKGF